MIVPLLWIGLFLQAPQAPTITAAVDVDGLTSGCTYLAQHPNAPQCLWTTDSNGAPLSCVSVWTGVVTNDWWGAYAPCCLPTH